MRKPSLWPIVGSLTKWKAILERLVPPKKKEVEEYKRASKIRASCLSRDRSASDRQGTSYIYAIDAFPSLISKLKWSISRFHDRNDEVI